MKNCRSERRLKERRSLILCVLCCLALGYSCFFSIFDRKQRSKVLKEALFLLFLLLFLGESLVKNVPKLTKTLANKKLYRSNKKCDRRNKKCSWNKKRDRSNKICDRSSKKMFQNKKVTEVTKIVTEVSKNVRG